MTTSAVSARAGAGPSIPGRSAAPWRRLAARALAVRATTPGRLRATRAMAVLLILLTGGLGAYGGAVRGDATRDIATRGEPVSSDVMDAYRQLADADVMAAAGFLPGSPAAATRDRYEADIERAATSLALAAGRSGGQPLARDRVSDISGALSRYTGLVASAQAGGSEFEEASALMQSTLLRRAEALQRDQAGQLASQYDRAAGLPVVALGFGLVTMAVLLVVQVRLFRTTRRILNVGLVTATVAIVGLTLWWALAFSVSGEHLASARRHSRSATEALGQAQIATRQARASEILALLVVEPRRVSFHEEQFSARTQRLARDDGAGGALGAARQLSSSSEGPALVEAAITQAQTWITAHDQARQLRSDGRRDQAVATAVGPAAAAFDQLDTTLAAAVAAEQAALRHDVDRSRGALRAAMAGTVLLALAAATCAARGIGKRMEDYR